MKIISKLPKGNCLVTMTNVELANILGYNSQYDEQYLDIVEAFINNEKDIPISIIYKKHMDIQNILNTAHYDTARKRLTDMLNALTPIENLIKEVSEIDK